MLLARSVGSIGMALPAFLVPDWRTGQQAREQVPRLPNGPIGRGDYTESPDEILTGMPTSRSYQVIRRTETEPPKSTRLAWSPVPRHTFADWAPGRMATPSGQPRAGTAAIGPVVAGRWAQTPSACIPCPRLPSYYAQQHSLAPSAAPRWPADEPPWTISGEQCLVERRDPIGPEDGQRFMRSTTWCSLPQLRRVLVRRLERLDS
jgi:hypothetical protein